MESLAEPRVQRVQQETLPISHASASLADVADSIELPPGGGHRRLPICGMECWGTAMPLRLACAGLQC